MNNKAQDMIDNTSDLTKETASLFSWSENYEYPSPATLFLDLIGYSDEHFGEPMYDLSKALGYLEIAMLADAMKEYAENPQQVSAFVETLLASDDEDEQGDA